MFWKVEEGYVEVNRHDKLGQVRRVAQAVLKSVMPQEER